MTLKVRKYDWQNILSYLTLLFLLIFSVLFYQERTIHTDNAFQHFLMLKEGFPQIMVHRYGMILIKLPPYVALLFGSSIPASLMVFSISYILLYSLIYLLNYKVLKNKVFAILVPVFFTTMMAYDFYWCASEQITGIAVMLLLIATIKPNGNKKSFWKIGLGIIILVNIFHPLIILPTIFFIQYLAIEHNKKEYLIWLVFIGIAILIKSIFFTSAYDSERISNFIHNIFTILPSFWKIESLRKFFSMSASYYPFFYFFLISSIGLLIKSGSYLKLALWLFWMLLHLLIISINEPVINFEYYAESNFLIFGVYAAFPFLMEATKLKHNNFVFILLFLCFSTSLFRIYRFHVPFTNRVEYLQNLVNGASHSKSYLDWDETDQTTLVTEWAVPFETALLSSYSQDQIHKTIYIPREPRRFIENLSNSDEFISVFRVINLEELNNRWINLPFEPYQPLTTE